jgi:hypothetical protein
MTTTAHERRAEAARRVRGQYPPLPEIFAALRATLGEAVAPPPSEPPPAQPEPEPEPQPEAAPEPEPRPEAEPYAGVEAEPEPPRQAGDPLGAALVEAARFAAGDTDDVAVALALAIEKPVVAAVDAGTRASRLAGVPGDHDVSANTAIDAVVGLLTPYAADVAAHEGDDPPVPSPELLARIRGVARSAGVVEAVRDTGWSAVQKFGLPYCARSACYGRNGSLLTAERIAAQGYPPYGDGCNCTAEAANLP